MTNQEEPSKPQAAGGRARADALSAKERKAIAKKAAVARWGTSRPIQALHVGKLTVLGDVDCAVLEDGRRVISVRGIQKILGRRPAGGRVYIDRKEDGVDVSLPVYLAPKNIKPFISEELSLTSRAVIPYQLPKSGLLAHGIEAKLVPLVCDVWLKARDARVLTARQQGTVEKADIAMRALAHVGIVALVDEATGYQEVRPKDALQRYLEAILRKELAAWSKKFPDEFYENIYKLRGWTWPGMGVNRYSVVAHYTRDLVYERLAPTLLEELEKKTPKNAKGQRDDRFHQWLTDDVGHPMLAQHLYSLIMFQRLAIANGQGWKRFIRMVDQVHPKKGTNLELPGFMDDDSPVAAGKPA